MPTPSSLLTDGLVKNTLAERLLDEIMNGKLRPGARIIEGKWAQQFGVAQGTIREAINILAQEGFVTIHMTWIVIATNGRACAISRRRSSVSGL